MRCSGPIRKAAMNTCFSRSEGRHRRLDLWAAKLGTFGYGAVDYMQDSKRGKSSKRLVQSRHCWVIVVCGFHSILVPWPDQTRDYASRSDMNTDKRSEMDCGSTLHESIQSTGKHTLSKHEVEAKWSRVVRLNDICTYWCGSASARIFTRSRNFRSHMPSTVATLFHT